ncbi:LAMI_0A08482g1_1 [Lachancea mirantina]|uniref:LAMI_0A08482g1_1 n=1 Tax=Lachancea mirantina TaxID=1230905 RepID=A0A1G4IRT0_9SACH|nr:LAMI_0A08482g1_1 [Lachancea mirantina]
MKDPGFSDKVHIFNHVVLRQDWCLILAMIVCTVGCGAVPAITSVLTGSTFGLLQSYAMSHEQVHVLMRQLTLKTMAILITGVASVPVTWLTVFLWMSLGERQVARIRTRIRDEYFQKSMAWYDGQDQLSGDFTQLNRCVEEVRAAASEGSAMVFQNVVTVFALFGISLYYSWSLTLVTLASTPILALITFLLLKLVNKCAKAENNETSRASEALAFSMNAAKMVRLLGTQEEELAKFRSRILASQRHFVNMSLFSSLNYSFLRFLTLCMFVQGFWFGNTMVRRNKLTVRDVMTCFSACVLLVSTANNISHQTIVLQKGFVAMQRIMDFFTTPEEPKLTLVQKVNNSYPQPGIIFENVSFSYPTRPNDMVLENVSLKFPSNQTTFVVGKSGSGKSSIGNLLLRFYAPNSGTILVNGVNIAALSEKALLANVTLLEQNCTLLQDTIEANILMGNKEISSKCELMREACQMALLSRILDDLCLGLQTLVGESGLDLSGGEKQRVALARARIKDSAILILDEALSAQDRVHHTLLMEAIRHWRKNKTTIIITHDLSDIQSHDYLYVFDSGKVAEAGVKEDLLANPFSQLSNLQLLQDDTQFDNDVKTLSEGERPGYNDKVDGFIVEEKVLGSEAGTPKSERTVGVFGLEDVNPLYEGKKSIDLLEERVLAPQQRTVLKALVLLDPPELNADAEKNTTENKKAETTSFKHIMQKMIETVTQKKWLAAGLVCSVVAGATNPLFSYTFSKLLGAVSTANEDDRKASYLAEWSGVVLAVAFGDFLFTFLKGFILAYCSEGWITTLRLESFEKISRHGFAWFGSHTNDTAAVSALILNDLRDLRCLVSDFISALMTLIVVSSCGLTWALVSGWKLSLVCISLAPLFLCFTGIYGSLMQARETEYKNAIAKLECLLYEITQTVKTVRCFSLQNHFKEKYLSLELLVSTCGKKRALAVGFGVSSSNALVAITQSILLYYGLKLVLTNEYSVGTMFTTLTLLLFTIMTSMSLISGMPEINRGKRAAFKVFQLLEEIDESEMVQTGKRTQSFHTSTQLPLIRFNGLTFSYAAIPHTAVLRNLYLDIMQGEVVGLVGQPGCGKSTLWQIITAIYQVENGMLFIDGSDVNEWNIEALRDQVAVVEQKCNLISGSVIDCLKYGNKNFLAEAEILDALAVVDMVDFVMALPHGLSTPIDNCVLSGGQLQRIAIARALLRKPKLLILDECSSALDAAHAHSLSNFIRSGIPGTTILVITHSEQMLNACSRAVTLKSGRVVNDNRSCQTK